MGRVKYEICGWKTNREDEDGERATLHDWQLVGAKVAYMVKDGHRTIVVTDGTLPPGE